MTLRVAVVGGGITGLTAAYALETRALADRSPVEVTLLEASDRLGGKLRTERLGNVLLEQGPDALFIRRPETVDVLHRLGLEDEVVRASTRHRGTLVFRAGRHYPLPAGMEGGVPRSLWPLAGSALLSPWGKARAALEAVLPAAPSATDESAGAFIRRRFGREVAERVAAPLLGSIYSGDIDELSLAALLPRLREAERTDGSVLRQAWRSRRSTMTPRPGPPESPFLTLRSGLASLPSAVRQHLSHTNILVHALVQGLQPLGGGYRLDLADGRHVDADRVVVTTPAGSAATLLAAAAPETAALLGRIHCTSVIVVGLVLPASVEANLPAGSGLVVAPDSRSLLTACSFTSRKWPHVAPDNHVVVRAHLHVDDEPGRLGLPDGDLVDAVRSELRAMFGISAEPLAARVYLWPAAIPRYRVGHLDRLAAIQASLAGLPGIHLAGAAYHGAGIPECIAQGFAAADAVLGARPGATPASLSLVSA